MQSLLEGGMKENMPTMNLVRKISLGQPNFGAPAPLVGNPKAGLSGLAEIGMLGRVNGNGGTPTKKRLSLSSATGGVNKTTQQSPKKTNPPSSPMLMSSPTRNNGKNSPVRGQGPSTPQRNALAKIDALEKEKTQLEIDLSGWRRQTSEALEALKERETHIQQLQQQIEALNQQHQQATITFQREVEEVREQLRCSEEGNISRTDKVAELSQELDGVKSRLEVTLSRCIELEQQQKEGLSESEAHFRGIVAAEKRLEEADAEKEYLRRHVDSLLKAQKRNEAQVRELELENEKKKETMEAELFYYQAIASKLDLTQSGLPCNTQIQSLYEMAKNSNIPRNQWPLWIPKQLASLSTSPLPSVPLSSLSSSSSSSSSRRQQQQPPNRGRGATSSRRK